MDNLEFAQSVPEETHLAIEGVKHAKDLWLEMLKGAKSTIDIGQFYIASIPGEAMEPVLGLIREKARSGIKVRLVVDRGMIEGGNYELRYFDNIKEIEIRTIDLKTLTNSIMHAKYMIIDREDCFLGSQNFDWRSLTQVHEIGVRIKEKKLGEIMTRIFENDWEIAKTDKLPVYKKTERGRSPEFTVTYENEPIKIRPAFSPAIITPPDLSLELDEVTGLINSAQREILVSVMEYSPKSSYTKDYLTRIDFSLREASIKGVQVKLLFTDWVYKEPNISFIKSLAAMPNIEVKASSIPRLEKKFIPFARVSHCKFMVVDRDKAWLGTTNWEPDYYLSSRNMSVVMEGAATNKKLRELFFNTWTQPFSEHIDLSRKYIKPQIGD
ncbi:MAG: phospholipase D-like domain-containing protein [bacterium]|nr:phospholipase D-like domain-containing protein [bacterium]